MALRLEAGVGEMELLTEVLGENTEKNEDFLKKVPGICTLLRQREMEIESRSARLKARKEEHAARGERIGRG